MKLILQAIKSLFRGIERLIDSTAAGLGVEITRLDNEKIGAQNPVMYGTFRMNPRPDDPVGDYSHAEGYHCTASGYSSHAEGNVCTASYFASHAEGSNCTASGYCSHAEGGSCIASEQYSHAEGRECVASDNCAHAEGNVCTASGYGSHAEGSWCIASGDYSHAEGHYCTASGSYSHAQGKYNIQDTQGKYAHIVGNGQDNDNRSNAHTLDWDGNAWFAGTVEGTALILKSSTTGSSKRFRITVDDSGTLSATEVTT